MFISLSILEYEENLCKHVDALLDSKTFHQVLQLIQTGKIQSIHIDVMRPPLIPNRITFPIKLIEKLYEMLHEKIPISIHLMVPNPILIVNEVNKFIPRGERGKTPIIIQRESFESEGEVLKAIDILRRRGYDEVGVCLDLLTPCRSISEETIKAASFILLMTVHMGRGRQKYAEEGTKKITYLSQRHPGKPIWVDGGINPHTARIAKEAGAKAVVVGSYITLSCNPLAALLELAQSLNG